MNQGIENSIQRRLRGAPGLRFCAFAVEAVLDDIQILSAQFDAAKIIERMINAMKLIVVISLAAAAQHGLRALQYPAIHFIELADRDRVLLRLEVVEIADQKPRGVSEPAIGFDQPIENLVRDTHVLAKVLGGDPQA